MQLGQGIREKRARQGVKGEHKGDKTGGGQIAVQSLQRTDPAVYAHLPSSSAAAAAGELPQWSRAATCRHTPWAQQGGAQARALGGLQARHSAACAQLPRAAAAAQQRRSGMRRSRHWQRRCAQEAQQRRHAKSCQRAQAGQGRTRAQRGAQGGQHGMRGGGRPRRREPEEGKWASGGAAVFLFFVFSLFWGALRVTWF